MPNVDASRLSGSKSRRKRRPEADAHAQGEEHRGDRRMKTSARAGGAGSRNGAQKPVRAQPPPSVGRRRRSVPQGVRPRAARRNCANDRRRRARPCRPLVDEPASPQVSLLRQSEMFGGKKAVRWRDRVCSARKNCPPGPTSQIASSAGSASSTLNGRRNSATIAKRVGVNRHFLKRGLQLPFFQPPPCIEKVMPSMIAAQSENTLS
jgi:hypothetical protein